MRILVADDEAGLRTIVCRMLGGMGHRAVCVDDGLALLLRVVAEEVDLVISDIGMPGCDGIRAGRLLRDAKPGLPLILMTGDPELARRARAHGFSLVLLKPFTADELTAVLSSF